MRGVIEIPLQKGRKELAWYVGAAPVAGTNQINPIAALKSERDADFVAKRLWLVQWPTYGAAVDLELKMPAQTTVQVRDGGTKRALSLVPGNARIMLPDASIKRTTASWLGLPAPYLIRANNNVFAELSNPEAATVPWVGDAYLVAEGFKVYPNLPEEFPATIKGVYAVPFDLNGNQSIANPSLLASSIAGQTLKITNDGTGKFLAKGFKISLIDAAGVDRTDALLPCLAFQITDSTSGGKQWFQNTGYTQALPLIPGSLLNMAGSFLGFNTPRYIDQNGIVDVNFIWSGIAAALAYVNGAATWPITASVSLMGSMMPR